MLVPGSGCARVHSGIGGLESLFTRVWGTGFPEERDMPPRSMWKGAISFGLVTIPVAVYPATEEKSLRFNQLHDDDMGRIRYKRVCAVDGEEVDFEHIVKGYEVDPILFKKSYYLVPEETGAKAYALLRTALAAENKVGIAKVSFRDKEHLAALRFRDKAFVLETMYWPDEIRAPEFEELDKKTSVRPQEVQMAQSLIDNLSESWDPTTFTDEYREALLRIVEAKESGEEITITETEAPSKVVDLMEALKASVAAAKKGHVADVKEPAKEPARARSKRKARAPRS